MTYRRRIAFIKFIEEFLVPMGMKNSPQFWLGLQMDWDLWHAERNLAEVG
jgi:hypothetical protein